MKNINLVVGAGFSGATIAHLVATELNEPVLVIDKKDHIAGNCYDYLEDNISIHKYGSHIFHTHSEAVWRFISKFTNFNTYMHEIYAVIDGIEATIPFNLNTIYQVFPKSLAERIEAKLLDKFKYNSKVPILEFQKQEDADLKFLAEFIYEKVFLHYTTKQWGVAPHEVDGTVTARVPVYISKDDRYFQDKYQGIPLGGYTQTIQNMLNHPNIETQLNTDYKDVKGKFKSVFYTGSIDEFFDCRYGRLPYRSVNFKLEKYDLEFYQQAAVINYPCNYDFTRIHEYKHYLNNGSEKTIIAKEFSESFEPAKNDRYYPIPNGENQDLYEKYQKDSTTLKNIYFLGRLGDYKYYDMDKAIQRAIELFQVISHKND